MKLFPEENIIVELPSDKVKAVLEKVTGQHGKIMREDYSKVPFTGWNKNDVFTMMPNIPNPSVKMKVKVAAEGMGKTRLTVSGKITSGRIILAILIALAAVPLTGLFFGLAFTDPSYNGVAFTIGLVLLFILSIIVVGSMKYPSSTYKICIFEMLRKLDKHDLVL